MRWFIAIAVIMLAACRKADHTPKTKTVTYSLKTPIGTGQKLVVTYMLSYNMAIPYQYGQLRTDTLSADSFRTTVTYTVDDPKLKGLAGYLKFAVVYYYSGMPITTFHPYYNYFSVEVNGVIQNAISEDGNYVVATVNW